MGESDAGKAALLDDFHGLVKGKTGPQRHDVFAKLRRDMPVFRSEVLDAWVFSRHADIKALMSDDDNYQPPKEGAGAPAYGRNFMLMHGREHSKKIGIVAREMRTQRALRDRLEGIVVELARKYAEALTPTFGQPIDLRDSYTMRVPLYTITELMQLPEAARFRDWYRTIVAGSSSSLGNPDAREAAYKARDEVQEFLEPIIAERQRNPGNDLLSDMANAEFDGQPFPHDEIVANIIFLLAAGVETTERVLTSTLRHLALDPAEWAWLRANYTNKDALSAFCAEALRYYPPLGIFVRTGQQDGHIAGVDIKPGDKVCVLSVSGNRDENQFPDASRFDHDRFALNHDRQFSASGDILTFGKGIHHCVGSRLAQLEMMHAFRELLDRVERIEPAGEMPEAEGFFLHSPPSLPVVLHPPR